MVRCQEMSQRSPTITLVDASAVATRYPGTRARSAVDEGAAAIGSSRNVVMVPERPRWCLGADLRAEKIVVPIASVKTPAITPRPRAGDLDRGPRGRPQP